MPSDQLVSLEIVNFQSLKSVKLEFGQFSVLVGPSSSGKSAVLRAVRAVTRNVTSPSAVSHGKSSFSVLATFADCAVGIERGKAKSVYLLDGVEYPKAGVKVPAAVANKLRMSAPQDIELFLADQFDRPYLLAETGSVAAKVLGELTNATLLMESAREANVRRQRHGQLAKLREQDVVSIQSRLHVFSNLVDEKQRLAAAREDLDKARGAQAVVDRLESAVKRYEVSAQVVSSAQSGIAQVPDVQDELLRAETSLHEVESLESLISSIVSLGRLRISAKDEIGQTEKQLDLAQSEEREVLRDMGTCPVCGQTTEAV